jgi:hypothetical protein
MKFFIWGFLFLLTETSEATAIPPWGISTIVQETTRKKKTTGTTLKVGMATIAEDHKLAKRGTQKIDRRAD